MAYSVLDELYRNGFIKQIRGRPAYDRGSVLDIGNPDATYVAIPPDMPDPKLLPLAFSQDPLVLMGRVVTPVAGQPSTECRLDLLAPDAGGGKAWKHLCRDVTLQIEVTTGEVTTLVPVLTNPADMAQAGNMLVAVDYDSMKVYLIGANELNGLPPGPHTLVFPYLDLSKPAPNSSTSILPANAKGQSVIALKGPDGVINVFAVYIVYDPNATEPDDKWSNSIFVWMKINKAGELEYVAKEELGKNAQEAIPVRSDADGLTLFVPCYGGPQNEGATNGTDSTLEKVVVSYANTDITAFPIITGDPVPDPTPDSASTYSTYDFRALAARFNGDQVYVLNGTMNTNLNQDWTLYRADIEKLLEITTAKTLSDAVEGRILDVVDLGPNAPGYYWDIFIESGIDIAGDRLWFLKGSTIQVTGAEEYGDDVKTYEPGYGAGEIDGINVNSVAFIAETLRQAALGMSLKRGLGGGFPAPVISASGGGKELPY
jgi:hypothetical protein